MNITISVLAGIQCLWQVGSHFKHKSKKNDQVRLITNKVRSNLFQFMKLVIFENVLLSSVQCHIIFEERS